MIIERIDNYKNFYVMELYSQALEEYFYLETNKSDLSIIKSYCTQEKDMLDVLQSTINKQRIRIKTGLFKINDVSEVAEKNFEFLKNNRNFLLS